MDRVKTFEATGIAPNGRLYAGDLNAIQDAAAALSDFSQTVDVGTVRIGETSLMLNRFAAGVAKITGALFLDEGLGLVNLTTTQRDAIVSGHAPKGTIIFNTTTGTFQINLGTDGARDWKNIGDVRQDLVDAKGDFLVGSAADTLARLAVGSNDQTILADSAAGVGAKWGHPILSYQQAALSGDVTMTNPDTFYDGPSVSLVAGTWFVFAELTIVAPANNDDLTAKLWDGTTVISSAGAQAPGAGTRAVSISLAGVVVLGSTTTYKVSAANDDTGGGAIKAASPTNGAGNNASHIVAVRIK